MDNLTIQISGNERNMKRIFRMLDMYRKRGSITIENIGNTKLAKSKPEVKKESKPEVKKEVKAKPEVKKVAKAKK